MPEFLPLLWRGFTVQRRVLAAIMTVQFVARWGRKNLGFAWLFLEPLVFAFPVMFVWSLVRAPYERGLPMIAFVWSGYMPLLIFRHVTSMGLHSIRGAVTLLYHQRVTPFDLFLGQVGLEALGNLAAMFLSFIIFCGLGFMDPPENYNLFFAGFLLTTWWSLAVALILASLIVRSEIVLHIWQPMSYLYIFYSGFFFMAAWLPTKLRAVVLAIDPPWICYEIIRAGMFGHRIQTFYDIPHLTYILLAITFLGFWLLRNARSYIELE